MDLLPNLCSRLRGTPARLEELFRHVPRQLISMQIQGAWSAQENAGHLADLEPLWLARVTDYVEAKDELTTTDLRNRKTDEANHNERNVELILEEFRAARARLIQLVMTVDDSVFLTAIRHPRLKTPMRLIDHLSFVAEHDDHHLARIWELVGSNGIAAASARSKPSGK
jgi:uncharacterized damage-inducible protein DinB